MLWLATTLILSIALVGIDEPLMVTNYGIKEKASPFRAGRMSTIVRYPLTKFVKIFGSSLFRNTPERSFSDPAAVRDERHII